MTVTCNSTTRIADHRSVMACSSAIFIAKRLIDRFVRCKSGVAAVEFAFIAPIMLVLALGAIEIREAVSADRKLNIIATSIGDLVARTPVLREGDIADMHTIIEGMMGRYGATNVGLNVSAVDIAQNGDANVVWSRDYNGSGSTLAKAHERGADLNPVIDERLRNAEGINSGEQQMIFVEIFMTYQPVPDFIGINLLRGNTPKTMELDLSDHSFNLTRHSGRTFICPDSWIPSAGFGTCEG